MKRIKQLLKLIAVLLLMVGCNLTNSVSEKKEDLELTFVDAASIEAWIEVKSNKDMPSWKVSIMQNGNYLYDVHLSKTDTIICLDSLSPKTKYEVYAISDGKKSNVISFSTLDTTSHDITWIDYQLGDDVSGYLNEIAIMNENNVNAVGSLYKNGEYKHYNLVKYNGNEWELERVEYREQGSIYILEYFSIYSVNSNSYWLGSAIPMQWNGSKYLQWLLDTTVFRSKIYSIGGTRNDNIYIGGAEGHLANYNGIKWQKINSKTDLLISGIKAYDNYKTGKEEVLCIAYNSNYVGARRNAIIKITERTNTIIENITTLNNCLNIWTNKGFPIYITGGGLYSNKTGKWEDVKVPTNHESNRMAINGLNDIIVNSYGQLAHYNGATWRVYNVNEGYYRDIEIKGNLIAMCGSNGSKPLIKIGIRN